MLVILSTLPFSSLFDIILFSTNQTCMVHGFYDTNCNDLLWRKTNHRFSCYTRLCDVDQCLL